MQVLRSRLVLGFVGALAIVAGVVWSNSSSVKSWIFSQAMPAAYFSHYDYIKPSLYRVSGPVYAFEKGFTRSLVIRTSEGLAVIDTFNEAHAREMKGAIATAFPGESVKWVILSHNHLDHVRGSSLFENAEVIGHADVNQFVQDWPEAGNGIASVTRPISGDQTLVLGDVEVQALYMPFSHSHTLYGFHVESAGVVYAPDMMFVKALPPFDFPDFYYPGYIRALDRLISLNAAHYVPSHTGRGTRQDLVDYRDMTIAFQKVVRDEILARGVEAPTHGPALKAALRSAYSKLQPKYGHWHGFDDMFVAKFGRHVGGTYLGY